ncbi:unnamed protein product (macronuclear) [Paramecium tetraurelia]|uniref:PAS domain-containing protein n=1 Tax=Paramecium tetraurelia TaxID=5888 RepID=A0DXP9_PARTE|nr:uncharacterized protein GSPATT00021440001 [Paramecium tetraurelia]CAK87816.1 unnamed protein product [Paramecium tetraurelia]|eukprot:XP_001455213.1 hypothetical protein (macronuclear) [Paramecium tetraurelia strain d4-2]
MPIVNIFLHSVIVLSYFYFYRSYQFNQLGLYRTFNLASYCYYLIVIFIVAIDWNSELKIQPYIFWLLSIFKLIDIILFLPYKMTFENQVYMFGCTGLFIVSLLGSLSQITSSISGDNIFETFLLAFPIFLYLFRQFQSRKWQDLILYMRTGSTKQMDIKKLCSSLEALVYYIEQARVDSYVFMLSLFVLKYHTENCNDPNCECKEDLSKSNTQNGESMTHRSSFQSRTALLSNADKNSNNQNISQNLDVSQFQKTIKDGSRKNDSFAGGVQPQYEQQNIRPKTVIFQPMKFVQNNTINEDLISQYVKRQFHQTIQQLSFSLHLDEVEYLSLKYISFMFSFKQNSLSSLTKLKQIQSRTVSFSYFFRNVTKVTESQFIDALKLKHFEDKNSYDDVVKMNVTEIWRLEMVKDDIVKSIVSVLRKKITLWENLCSGDIQNMNRFLEDIIKISLQIEESRSTVDMILSDFTNQVQRNYSYYLKYQCFRSLFFDSDYKQAVIFQRKVEDSWQLSRAAQKQGQIGNFQWLSGDLVTLEVSAGVQSGQIIKGVSNRLVDMLGYSNYEDMIQNLRIRGLQSSHQNQNSDKLQISSIMPPYLTASHNYFITRFIHRGYTYYYDKPINSYACDAQGFVFPVNINLSFNFQNLTDFTLLGSILKIKDDDEYLIFDEWGRILGVSMHTFDKLILKGALDEFGMVQYKSVNAKFQKLGNLKNALLHKIARDDNAKLFKKTITMHQKQSTTKSQLKRTYQKPSDILLQFGSIQHFLPQVGKSITDLLARDIFKKLQRESQEQFNKLTDKAQDIQQQNNNKLFEKQASNIFQRQISQFIDRQQSLNQGGLSSAMLDKDQYRNFIINNFIDDKGLMKKNVSLLQDERLVLYVPRNYNELIEYFNDAGERFMESKNDMETKSIRRQQMQNKYSYIKQQQNCYHLFDAEFQDFIDNKVRKYYSKALLKEALESHDAKLLQQVRYKCVSSIDVGVGGVSDKDQFLYFVCKLSSLNLQTAKRKDVLKIHLKKEKNQQFDGGEELRRSLIQQASSLDSFDKEKPRKSLPFQQQESFGPPQQQIKYKGEINEPIIVTLAIPDSRTYLSSLDRDDGPNMKVKFEAQNQKLNDSSFDIENSMKESFIPTGGNHSMTQSLNLNVPQLMRQNSIEKMKQIQNQSKEYLKEQSSSLSEKKEEPPKKKLKLSFLKKMEKALVPKDPPAETPTTPIAPTFLQPQQQQQQEKQPSSLSVPEEKKSSFLNPTGLFAKLFGRLNLRRVSNIEIKNDQFEAQDQGFREQSENSEKGDMKRSGHSTPSGTNSMSSNNITSQGDQKEDDEELNNEDELVNIFEVMSQASNHQSIKSISAISMATQISLRCLKYMPRQAKSLQIFKIILIILNISCIISLLLTTQNYFNNLSVDNLSLRINNQYRYSAIILQSSNQIDQQSIITFDQIPNITLMNEIISYCYNLSLNISQSYFDVINSIQNEVSFPLPQLDVLQIPDDYYIVSLQEFLTQQKIEIDSIELINTYNRSDATFKQLYNNSIDYLLNRLVFTQSQINNMSQQLRSSKNNDVLSKALIVTYLMASFGGLHLVVILLIVPFIRQINNIYFRVLCIVSRITQEEAEDEIKKLTLSQHLLETQDDSWVTQNQIKLIFYNKSKEIDLNEKYTKNGNVKAKGKESSYFYSKLSDTTLSIWKDMGLYIMISAISIGYLIFSIVIIQTQINTFTPFIDNFDETVSTSVYTASLISKLSITPQRYLNLESASIPSQFTLLNFQQNQQLSYFLQTISSDTNNIKSFITDMQKFLEQVNLDYGYDSNSSKILITSENYQSRIPYIQQLSVLSEINHLLKDNLCYYSEETLCQQQQQFDYFNTGLMGALDVLQKMEFSYQTFLNEYHQIQYSDQQNNTSQINAYYNSQDYRFLVMYGQELIFKTFDRLVLLLETFLNDEKESTKQLIQNLFIGIGIPIMFLTILLAALEMNLLKQKVRRVMLSLTFLPTFKFQDKIVLSLIKAILKI